MYPLHTLSNGIKVVVIPSVSAHVCHCGLLINAGSRDEKDDEYGLAHFVEHTIFKGTDKRSAYHILSRLDEVGGELNAYTTKEETAVHASFLPQYLERAASLISDMVFCSVFPEKEIEREREVIIDEITSYLDTPSETIFDELEERIFANSPLGHNILGSIDSVRSFSRADAERFCRRCHLTNQMAFVVWGHVDENRVLRIAEKYFGCRQQSSAIAKRTPVNSFNTFTDCRQQDTHQAHVVLGFLTPSAHDDARLSVSVLNNLLGGPCMNSRLSIALRERSGIAYNVETSYSTFDDTGLLTIYFGTDQRNINRSLSIVKKEINRLASRELSPAQLSNVLRQYTGQLLMSADSGESIMLSVARSAIVYNSAPSVEEICQHVQSEVTAKSLLSAAQTWLATDNFAQLIYV